MEKPKSVTKEEEFATLRYLLEKLIQKFDPYPAMVLNEEFEMLAFNEGARFIDNLMPNTLSRFDNVFELLLSEEGFRPFIVNWERVLLFAIARLREVALSSTNPRLQALLVKISNLYEGEPVAKRRPESISPLYLQIDAKMGTQPAKFSAVMLNPGMPLM